MSVSSGKFRGGFHAYLTGLSGRCGRPRLRRELIAVSSGYVQSFLQPLRATPVLVPAPGWPCGFFFCSLFSPSAPVTPQITSRICPEHAQTMPRTFTNRPQTDPRSTPDRSQTDPRPPLTLALVTLYDLSCPYLILLDLSYLSSLAVLELTLIDLS